MIARKRMHLIVIALCLWLPLQAIAGQWLDCVQLNANLMQPDTTPEPARHSSCHDSSAKADLNHSTPNTDALISADIPSCKHCQFSCTWHSALVLSEFMQPSLHFAIIPTQFISLSPAQPLLATPQRPPRFSIEFLSVKNSDLLFLIQSNPG